MKTDDEDVLAVKLPEEGEYKLDVFEKKPNGAVDNICTYQLIRHEPLADEGAKREKEQKKVVYPYTYKLPHS